MKYLGKSVEDIYSLTKIDRWFLNHFADLVKMEEKLEKENLDTISTKSSSFSATPIREALERVEQRQQIEVEKKQDYGRDYDSPSQF